MHKFKTSILGIATFIFVFTACTQDSSKNSKGEQPDTDKPNIIYILADDLGYGDLGCYGQSKIETPNIDKLAATGMRFTQHYSGSTVCAPSRSALMTGQHTGHTPIRGNKPYQPEGQEPMPDSVNTLAQMMQKAGYKTAAFGKWGLGFVGTSGDPNKKGFDHFFGYNCQSLAHRYYPAYLWSDSTKIFLEGNDLTQTTTYAHDVIHNKALQFIRESEDEPFFLFLPYTIPHAELIAPEDSLMEKYRAKNWKGQPYIGGEGSDYGPNMNDSGYASCEEPRTTFAAMVSRLDVYVGQVMQLLNELGLKENTIVIFTSDNGPHVEGGADPEFFNSNGPLRGVKRDLYEGGIRVPMIANWPGKIEGGTTSDHISAFWDMMPTFAELAGVEVPNGIDGVSMVPALMGENDQPKHDYLYWEFHEQGGKQAVRKGKWKAVKLNVKSEDDDQFELYDLSNDLGETRNLYEDHPEIYEELHLIMKQEHEQNSVFPFYPKERNNY